MNGSSTRALSSIWLSRASRVPGWLRARWTLAGAHLGGFVHLDGRLRVRGPRGISLGQRVFFLDGPVPSELVCRPGAELSIGGGTGLNYGTSIRATRSVRIGASCLVGSMVLIRDDDGFRTAPVVIGDEVWIAHGAIIEPGVTIGDGAVISAGAVVTGAVPAGMMAVGNPARCLPRAFSAERGSSPGP